MDGCTGETQEAPTRTQKILQRMAEQTQSPRSMTTGQMYEALRIKPAAYGAGRCPCFP